MIRHLLSSLRKKKNEPLVYSRVVSNPDKTQMIEMLKIAARKANEDQRALVSSSK